MSLRRIVTFPNMVLLTLAVGVGILLFLVLRLYLLPSLGLPDPGDSHPFLLHSEFATVNPEDRENLEKAAREFIAQPEWQSEGYGDLDIDFGSVLPLTKGGERIGVTGYWRFGGRTMVVPWDTSMVWCGEEIEIVTRSDWVMVVGLRVDLLDGQPHPYSVRPIPLSDEELEKRLLPGVLDKVRGACDPD